jgi:hypothetical protein
MPSEKERLELRTGKAPQRVVEKFKSTIRELYDVDPEEYINQGVRLTCINDFCAIHSEEISARELRLCGLRVIYEGLWLGVYTKKTVLPSTTLASRIIRERGLRSAIIVSDQGVKAFLYGNDILPESVIKKYPSKIGIYTVIDHSDNEVIGFSKWSSRKNVYVNLYDVGIFLRILG